MVSDTVSTHNCMRVVSNPAVCEVKSARVQKAVPFVLRKKQALRNPREKGLPKQKTNNSARQAYLTALLTRPTNGRDDFEKPDADKEGSSPTVVLQLLRLSSFVVFVSR